MKHSCVSGQQHRDKPRPNLGARCPGAFQTPAQAGSGRRERNQNSAPGILQQRQTVLQLQHRMPGDGRRAPAGVGMTRSWGAEMQLPAPALGRRVAPATAPRSWVQTTRGPALANIFILTRRMESALSEVAFTRPATWKAARAEPRAAQSSRARAAPVQRRQGRGCRPVLGHATTITAPKELY